MKLLRIYYWYVKIPQCRYIDHGLKDMKCYVKKHMVPRAICYNPPLVRNKPLGAPAYCETPLLLTVDSAFHLQVRSLSKLVPSANDTLLCCVRGGASAVVGGTISPSSNFANSGSETTSRCENMCIIWTDVSIPSGDLHISLFFMIMISFKTDLPVMSFTYRGYPAKRALSAMRKHGG